MFIYNIHNTYTNRHALYYEQKSDKSYMSVSGIYPKLNNETLSS